MADVTVYTLTDADIRRREGVSGPYWTDVSTGYVFIAQGSIFADQEVHCYKTTDKGASWSVADSGNGPQDVNSGTHISYWYEPRTPGNSGTKIHAAWLDFVGVDTGNVMYNTFDTSTDSWGTEVTIASAQDIKNSSSDNDITITVARSGRIFVAWGQLTDPTTEPTDFDMWYSDNGTSWTSTAPIHGTTDKMVFLLPGNETDQDDIYAVIVDDSDDFIFAKFDMSGGTWTSTTISTTLFEVGFHSTMKYDKRSHIACETRHSDSKVIVIGNTRFDSSFSEGFAYEIDPNPGGTPSGSQKTNWYTDTFDIYYSDFMINQQNDDIYVVYCGQDDGAQTITSIVDVHYKVSTDDLATWGSETTYSTGTNDDFRRTSTGMSVFDAGGRFMPVFENNDLTDIFVNDGNDVEIAAAAGDTSADEHDYNPPRRFVRRGLSVLG